MPPKQAKLDGEEWEVLLHTVAAEVLTLRKAGRDVLQVCNARSVDSGTPTRGVTVSNAEGDLLVETGAPESEILASIPEDAAAERAPGALETELAQALASGGGQLFLALKLNDPLIKFAVRCFA